MNQKKSSNLYALPIFILMIFLISCKSEVFNFENQEPAYTIAKYSALSDLELEERKQVFLKRNGNSWSVKLDQYGFANDIKTSDSSFVSQDEATQDLLTEEDMNRLTQFILNNADFFGVDNPDNFQLKFVYSGNAIVLVATQKFNNYTFLRDNYFNDDSGAYFNEKEIPIVIYKDTQTVPDFKVTLIINSHFWPSAVFPETPKISRDDVKQRFIGNEFEYYESDLPSRQCRAANRPTPECVPQLRKGNITEANLNIKLGAHLFNTKPAELRLVYMTRLYLRHDWPTKYIDAITGEELNSMQ